MLLIDGAHRYRPARADIRDWGRRVTPGGVLLIHDSFSSIGVTLGLLIGALPSRSLRYSGRHGSLAVFRRTKPTLGSRLALLGQLGWFSRNVLIKVLLRLRLRPVARMFGHHSPVDPY